MPRFLINNDGQVFNTEEVSELRKALDSLNDAERIDFRNQNASAIAESVSNSILIVSGPGTGKSYIFLRKIGDWLTKMPEAKIQVLSFVRKLVFDLQADVISEKTLTDEQKERVQVSTLHKLAKSITEINHGTAENTFQANLKLIVDTWEEVIWQDILNIGKSDKSQTWTEMRKARFNSTFPKGDEWNEVIKNYFQVLKFYNAISFAEIIPLAKEVLVERPELINADYFILDEYQDFNQAEEDFVSEIVKGAKGVLMVGDDDQVLYEKLKEGKASLIRNHYADEKRANAMLPYCGRCSLHVTKVASHFISSQPEENCIDKVYLPLAVEAAAEPVACVACAQPTGSVDYIAKFIEEHKEEIIERKILLDQNQAKDAFLLILSPDKKLKYFGEKKNDLLEAIAPYQSEEKLKYSEDYFKVLTYYSLGKNPLNNYSFRKILFYENVAHDKISELILTALNQGESFVELKDELLQSYLDKALYITAILEGASSPQEKAVEISKLITNINIELLTKDIDGATTEVGFKVEHEDEESAELEELEPSKTNAIEIMSIAGSKGLSADHVIILGFDNVNMSYVTRNAFYVAMTRARKTLHLITTLQAGGATGPSKYLEDLPDENIKFLSHKKTESETTNLKSREGFLGYFQKIAYAKNKNK